MLWVMATTLRPPPARVLDESDLRGDARAVRQAGGEQLARRRTRQRAEVAVEVRLVRVAALGGDLRPAAGVGAHEPDRAVEAQHAGGGLRREPDVLAQSHRQ